MHLVIIVCMNLTLNMTNVSAVVQNALSDQSSLQTHVFLVLIAKNCGKAERQNGTKQNALEHKSFPKTDPTTQALTNQDSVMREMRHGS